MFQSTLNVAPNVPASKTMLMSLYMPKTPPKPEAPKPVVQEPTPVVETPKPLSKPLPPKREKKHEKKSDVVVDKLPQEPLLASPTPHETVAEPLPSPKTTMQNSDETDHKRQDYIARLLERINAHKVYPKTAQRSHIEGDVTVEFTVSPTGDLVSLTIMEGKQIFHKATKEAFYKSFPCPMSEQLFSADTTFRVALSYSLL
jgi:TonB family protein